MESVFYNTNDFILTNENIQQEHTNGIHIIKNQKDKKDYSLKIINPDRGINGNLQMQLLTESILLYKLDHPAISKFYGISFQSFTNPDKFEPSYITEHFPKGSLRENLNREKESATTYFNSTNK